ncbi:MAG: helix-turn-helix transcriptional regulator [Anaerolineae bacterium]
MRADRLLSLLMLLQARGQMTAAELAGELEVSERTIYRDLDALTLAGVPVYAERGPGGGCRLMEGWRSDLTGLTSDELGALAALEIPAPLVQLGVGQMLRQALLKLLAAQPGSAPARVYVDPAPWSDSEPPAVPLLGSVYRALTEGRRLRVARAGPHGEPYWLELDPYGLVSKEGRWYLLAGSGEHTVVFRVDHLLSAEALEARAVLPAGLDLRARWERAWRTLVADRQPYPVRLEVSVALLPELRRQFPACVGAIERALAAEKHSRVTLELPFGSLEDARTRILPWGGAARVISPLALRESLADYAHQTAAVYDGERRAERKNN